MAGGGVTGGNQRHFLDDNSCVQAIQSIKAIHSRRADEHSNEKCLVRVPMIQARRHGRAEREREKKEWQSLTLTCRDVAVSPVDPIFMICNVAPRLNIPIRIPADIQATILDHVNTKLVKAEKQPFPLLFGFPFYNKITFFTSILPGQQAAFISCNEITLFLFVQLQQHKQLPGCAFPTSYQMLALMHIFVFVFWPAKKKSL